MFEQVSIFRLIYLHPKIKIFIAYVLSKYSIQIIFESVLIFI